MKIGIDIGGTFTDLAAIDERGQVFTTKTPTTPRDPSAGVMDGLASLAQLVDVPLEGLLARTKMLIHGTTVATNCLAERNGASIGMITSAGFRDILELREGTKAGRYDLHSPFPQPLIARPNRLEVPERMRWDGSVEVALDRDAVLKRIAILRARDVEAVVVCFLHSHIDPSHELKVRELIAEQEWDVYVVLSHEILGREGEYDRFSTAAVNAYVGPRLQAYLRSLERRLEGAGAGFPLMIMQSNGGLLPPADAGRYAVGSVNSGPAGGAMASALFADLLKAQQTIAYDMGGTTTDISIVDQGRPVERRKTELADIKIAVPSIDIDVVPIGGGSIARIDNGGILTLGPGSAGAVPGPACYGRGGEWPTLTDANLVLGYISAHNFLGGRMPLDLELACHTIRDTIARPLGLSVEQASFAIHELASIRIAESVRAAALRRGLDPRELMLLSFGGAGGAHTAAVAAELSIPKALIPREAPVFSAVGFLAADVRLDSLRPLGKPVDQVRQGELEQLFADLQKQLGKRMDDLDFGADRTRIEIFLDCRYRRQRSTIEVAVPDDALGRHPREWLIESFEARYRRYYGHVHADEMPFIEACHISAYGIVSDRHRMHRENAGAASHVKPNSFRNIYTGEWVEAPVYWLHELPPDMAIHGPALIESATTVIVLPRGQVGQVGPFGSFSIRKGDIS